MYCGACSSAAGPSVEQAGLHRVALGLLGEFHGDADRGQQLVAVVIDAVEGAGLDQRLDGAAVDHALVAALAEVEQVRERPAGFARLEDDIDRLLAGALDRPQPVADRAAVDRLETVIRGIDVRPEHLHLVGDGVVVEDLHRVGVVHVRRQRRRHEGRAVVRLEPGGLIGDDGVGGGVRLVEAVLGELRHQVEQLLGERRVVALFLAPRRRSVSRCLAISSGFFLPIARRSMSAPPSV